MHGSEAYSTYKTIELIIYVIVQVYAKIGTYFITCLLYFYINNQYSWKLDLAVHT